MELCASKSSTVEYHHWTKSKSASSQDTDETNLESIGCLDHVLLSSNKQVGFWVLVGSFLSWGAVEQVEWIGKQWKWEEQATQSGNLVHSFQHGLCHWMPRLIILYVSMVGMVSPVTNSPSMVWNHDGRVDNVSNKVIQCLV